MAANEVGSTFALHVLLCLVALGACQTATFDLPDGLPMVYSLTFTFWQRLPCKTVAELNFEGLMCPRAASRELRL